MNKVGICIWCRLPWVAMQAKTRIGAEIGNQLTATKISHLLTDFFFEKIKDLPFDFYLYHAPCNIYSNYNHPYINIRFLDRFEYNTKLDWISNTNNSLNLLLIKGYQKAIACVSDCPYIEHEHLSQMIGALDKFQYVILPAKDKGVNAYGTRNGVTPDFQAVNVVSRTPNYSLLDEILTNFAYKNYQVDVISEYLTDIDSLSDVIDFYHYLLKNEIKFNFLTSYHKLIYFIRKELGELIYEK